MNELVTRIPPYHGTDKKDVAKKVVTNPNYRPPYNEKKVPKDWIDKYMSNNWIIKEYIPNEFPYEPKNSGTTSFSDFYFYEKIK